MKFLSIQYMNDLCWEGIVLLKTKNTETLHYVAVDRIALNYWGKHKRKMAIRGIN